MKICNSWLQEWVGHELDPDAVAERLTMLGLEVESVTRVGARVERLVVGRVVGKRRHPNADKLSLCEVDVGTGKNLGIVCGAPNVREGGLYATALEGAQLPGGLQIKAATIRGEPSAGMLCSAAELGLESATAGLLELDAGAASGADASELLRLGDAVLDINVTPNRADCLSVAGIALEIGAATGSVVAQRPREAVEAVTPDTFAMAVSDEHDCPRFAGRVIRGIRHDARTPLWMQERLRRCGIRPIHPIVDVTNYVMLELGQPMHAYDLGRLHERIVVRRGAPGERLVLLDGREVAVDGDVLVIAHRDGAIGLAGIMGGAATAVDAGTQDVFLESAFFSPAAIAGRARRFGLHTDAATRFERGVDPTLQVVALERATGLILGIAGGSPGPISDLSSPAFLPAGKPVRLRRERMQRVLGTHIADAQASGILGRLGMRAVNDAEGWLVTPPPARFDIEREEDLIEEVARVHGYERIDTVPGKSDLHLAPVGETVDPVATIAATLVARGYHEAITYSFVDPELARRFGAREAPQLALSNPISADLATMRQSLWPGLVQAVRQNLHRQQGRVRLFEIGSRFLPGAAGEHREEPCVAGIIVGTRLPEQWGVPSQRADFFDARADVEALLIAGRSAGRFTEATHPALHPGRSARLDAPGMEPGWLGELHPALLSELELPGAVVFEIPSAMLVARARASHGALSRFPSIRRDIAIVVPRTVPAAALLETVRAAAPEILRDAFVFDIYTGEQVGEVEKSVAIGLILQDTSRTLTDVDADRILLAVRQALSREWQARIRE